MSIIGVALSCALITAIFTSVATLYEGLLKAEIVTEGAWQVELVNVPEDEIDVVHADSRVTRSYERISYGDAIMPKSFEGYWGRYLSVQEWPTADKVKGLKPLPHIAEGRAPQAPDEIVLTHNLKGLTVENGSWLYDNLPTTRKLALRQPSNHRQGRRRPARVMGRRPGDRQRHRPRAWRANLCRRRVRPGGTLPVR